VVGPFVKRSAFDYLLITEKVTFRRFFEDMIKGVVCGYRIEEIEDEFEVYKQCRQMEKSIDELAIGRKMEKIIRKEKSLISLRFRTRYVMT